MTQFQEEIVKESPDRPEGLRMAEAVGISSDIRYCACGCGEVLKPNAKQQYVRGHKLAQVAGISSKDPDRPKDDEKNHPVFPGDKLPKDVKEDLEGKLEFFLTLFGTGWEAKDPLCGGEFNQRTDRIAEKLVPIIAKSPELLRWFTASGNVSVWMDLAMVLWPIGKMVAQHHVIHSIGNETPEEFNPLLYPVD